jgi:hypothetical protein
MTDAKRRTQPNPAPARVADAVVAPGLPFTVDLGGWRLAVRVATPAARAPEASFWSGPGLYARRIARRH